MTVTPLGHGYPDWGRQTAASDIQVVNSVGLNLTGLTQLGVFPVHNLPYLYVRTDSASSTNLGLAWFADSAATISLTGDTITTAVGGSAIQCVPVRGPFVKLTIERGAYPGTVTVQVFMVPKPFNAYAGTAGETNLIESNAVAIAGPGLLQLNATETRGGRIFWNGEIENAAAMIIRLYAVDFAGTTHLIDFTRENGRSMPRMIFAPALPLRVDLQNLDGVAHNSFCVVTHHPFDM